MLTATKLEQWKEYQERVHRSAPPGREEDGAHRSAPSSALSTAHISPQCEYVTGASYLKVNRGGYPLAQIGGGKRGRIKGFSRQSRRRLMITISKVQRSAELPLFVTLTYPNEFPEMKQAKRDLDNFFKRFERSFPNAGVMWKLEPQERGAPHFHLLVWGCDWQMLFPWTVREWFEVAGRGDEKHWKFHAGEYGNKKCVERVRSFKGVWSYASKYLGKTFEVAGWSDKWTGRYWGVVHPDGIPFGQAVVLLMEYRHAIRAMRYQRRFAHIRPRGKNRSLTIFCDAEQWIQKLNMGVGPPINSGNELVKGGERSGASPEPLTSV